MASHRRLTLIRHFRPLLFSTTHHSPLSKSETIFIRSLYLAAVQTPQANTSLSLRPSQCIDPLRSALARHYSSRPTDSSGGEDDDEEEGGDDDGEDEEEDYEDADGTCNGSVTKFRVSGKTEDQKMMEAAAIGYKVVGPLDLSERPFKPWEPAFAVVQIGSHQFKVCNGDSIFTERLKFCDVNDKLILNKVLMLGSKTQTIIGRPMLPDAAVNAVVEEHALDAKVIIFKKKRRKNYRRTKGHRQELTKLRITDIQGVEKCEGVAAAA